MLPGVSRRHICENCFAAWSGAPFYLFGAFRLKSALSFVALQHLLLSWFLLVGVLLGPHSSVRAQLVTGRFDP